MSTPWYLFLHPVVLKVGGKDARRYLHNRLSNDIRALQAGEACRAAALTAQGRVEGLFAVFADSEDTFYLVCDAGDREAVRAAVGRFIVADRVTIEDISDSCTVFHVGDEPEFTKTKLDPHASSKLLVLPHARVGTFGTDVLTLPNSQLSYETLVAHLGESLTPDRYAYLRIAHGEPTFPDEVHGEVILTEAGLYDAVSFTKGCYVGQEVIERSDAIGKLPRALERIRLVEPSEIAVDTEVLSASGERIGKVVSCAPGTEGASTFVFALLRTGKYGIGDSVSCAGLSGEILARPEKKRS